MDNTLTLKDGTKFHWFERKAKHFLNQTTLIYGRRFSGKSTVIDEIMYLLKDYISIPFIICQSNMEQGAYDGKVPDSCIKTSLDKEWISRFLNSQKDRAELYKKVNSVKYLKPIFDVVKSPAEDNVEKRYLEILHTHLQKISMTKMTISEKKSQEKKMKEQIDQKLIELYKKIIRNKTIDLEKMKHKFTADEICCIKFIDFEPHVLLIFDDCASAFKKWTKESPEIKEIMYNGRHYYITIIITSQDDKEIDSELRKNAMISIFTTSQAATSNFTRTSNGYSKYEKQKANYCIEECFKKLSGGHKNYNKLVFNLFPGAKDTFMYYMADEYFDFQIGCKGAWEVFDKVKQSSNNNSKAFFKKYSEF